MTRRFRDRGTPVALSRITNVPFVRCRVEVSYISPSHVTHVTACPQLAPIN